PRHGRRTRYLTPVATVLSVATAPCLDSCESALLLASLVAELGPMLGSPPRTSKGVFALTAFCLAFASASAFCLVSADCKTFCSWPLPPHPERHVELPPVCVAFASWSVLLLF